MKKNLFKRRIVALLGAAVIFAEMTAYAPLTAYDVSAASDIIAQGNEDNTGSSCWVLDRSGTLTVRRNIDIYSKFMIRDYREYVKKIVVEEGVTLLPSMFFSQCTNLEEVILPDSLLTIENSCFESCGSLRKIDLPKNLEVIGKDVFSGCGSLEKINISKENKFFCSDNGVLFDKNMKTLLVMPSAKTGDYTVPAGTVKISETAFYEHSLSSVAIPKSVTVIENVNDFNSFYSEKLKKITVDKSNKKYSSKNGVLFDKAQKTLLCFPPAVTGTYTIPASVTAIGIMYPRNKTGD